MESSAYDHTTCEYSGLRSLASILQEQEELEAQRVRAERSVFTEEERDRIIQMAWEDRTPFEAITAQFRLKEKDVITLMRSQLQPSSFRLWRRRMKARRTKHAARRATTVQRFKSRQQRDTSNRMAKR
jgi:uncharacterized protein (TIGR03643 family)